LLQGTSTWSSQAVSLLSAPLAIPLNSVHRSRLTGEFPVSIHGFPYFGRLDDEIHIQACISIRFKGEWFGTMWNYIWLLLLWVKEADVKTKGIEHLILVHGAIVA